MLSGGIIDTQQAIEQINNQNPNPVEEYLAQKEQHEGFIKAFKNAIAEITSAPNGGPVVVLIDELDRCRPDYAVTLLERIKHLLTVENVVFVLAIDRTQIKQSIGHIFGMDAARQDDYLRKFIDQTFILPLPPHRAYAKHLWSVYKLDETPAKTDKDEVISIFSTFAEAANMPLRNQEQCFAHLAMALRTNAREYAPYLVFLCFLRSFDQQLYKDYVENNLSLEKLQEVFQTLNTPPIPRVYAILGNIKGSHRVHLLSRANNTEQIILYFKNQVKYSKIYDIEYLREPIDSLLKFHDSDFIGCAPNLIQTIEMLSAHQPTT